ncbi:protein FAR1-RELATED SEQUENCE 5-like [Pistacia vera]|uniref:protein FAR1-RELATED SEQUENCE 5-like n=1 Tax=Pistacia vera TaxID=55513 RepID=UPI00126355AE|nr:protein FAR1-RELATED SEQUENCE 5-like [Pistacia vera]
MNEWELIGDNHFQEIEDTRNAEEDWEPKLGMVFDSFDELLQYYKSYGSKRGFEAIIRSSRKGDDGELRYATLACSCSGKWNSNSRNAFKMHPVTKTDCKAHITASLHSNGKWKILSIVIDHNHELSSPGKTRYFKSNRIIQPYVKRKIELNDKAGIRPNKNFNSLLVEAGSGENLPFLQKDCRNYIEKVRRLRLGLGDASAIQKYFLKMQNENLNFFYIMDVDEDGRLKNILWVDAGSRAAFKEFGDVVTFDTTYLTNKYDMPFGAFVGVDHHDHSILLGCGLISNEDTETFVWLFQSWLVCMLNCALKTIITDQDKTMQNAIEIVFPSTRHRWCEEFEERWNMFIDKYNLHDNGWLLGLYNERRRWVPALVKDTFWRDKVEKERAADFKSFRLWIPCITTYAIEKQFQDSYTIVKFKEFQRELAAKIYCDLSSFKETDSCMEFIIEEDVVVGETHRRVPFVVCFDEATCDVRCNCRLFEFRGILYSTSSNEDDCNMVIEMINDMKNKLTSNKSVGGIGKRLNVSTSSRTNCEGVDDTTKEGSSNILTPWAMRSKGRPPLKRKQLKLEQIVRKVKEKKLRKQ